MKFSLKQIIAVLTIVSFLTIVFFSFVMMMHGSDKLMPGECPFSAMGQSLCPSDAIDLVTHNISAYYAFLNVPISFGLAMIIIVLLFFVCLTKVLFIDSNFYNPSKLVRYTFYSPPPNNLNKIKVICWLSLLENSPSFS